LACCSNFFMLALDYNLRMYHLTPFRFLEIFLRLCGKKIQIGLFLNLGITTWFLRFFLYLTLLVLHNGVQFFSFSLDWFSYNINCVYFILFVFLCVTAVMDTAPGQSLYPLHHSKTIHLVCGKFIFEADLYFSLSYF
jgi:hypothetical protein